MAGNHRSGRKPLPANIHILNGNPSKKPAAALMAEIRPDVETPEPPDFLTDEALAEWHRICPLLERVGLISGLYRASLAAYCQAWGRYAYAEARIKELREDAMIEQTPSGYRQMGVWLQISNRAAAEIKSLSSEFGLTPAAIARASSAAQKGDPTGHGDTKKEKGAERFFG